MDNKENEVSLGICKQAIMKLESFMVDISELKEEPGINESDREDLEKMMDISGLMASTIMSIATKEYDEEEFVDEDIQMDPIDTYPGDDNDILDSPIE